MEDLGFSRQELRSLRALRSPVGIQRALDAMPYHLAKTVWSPRRVLHERTAHCLEAAIFAATALRVLGFPPLILDLEAVQDTDHVIAVYRGNGHWGAIAKSNYSGLRYREPVYRTVRELVMSYFEHYYNLRREKTLRRYSRPVNIARFDAIGWMTAEDDVWPIPDHLCTISHTDLVPAPLLRSVGRVDDRLFAAGLVGRVI